MSKITQLKILNYSIKKLPNNKKNGQKYMDQITTKNVKLKNILMTSHS